MIIYTIEMYKGLRTVINLKWSRRDKDMTQHGAYPNRGTLNRYIKTVLRKEIKQVVTKTQQPYDERRQLPQTQMEVYRILQWGIL